MPKDNSDIMMHCNGNLMCAIDTETSGLDPSINDIIQICILPLNSNFQPLEELYGRKIFPFNIYMKPRYPEKCDKKALSVNGIDLPWLMANGFDIYEGQTMFDKWFESLELGYMKRITPLGYNYQFDKRFIGEWLGNTTYEACFHYHYRDPMITALSHNDLAYLRQESVPYPILKQTAVAQKLGISTEGAHDAVADCAMSAEIYRRMLQVATIANYGTKVE